MSFFARARTASLLALTAFFLVTPANCDAQTARQQISANPFAILLGFFNGEYERRVSSSGSLNIGGSFFENGDLDYVNADLTYRYYPLARPLEGWAFGVKVGVTSVKNFSSYPGIGFDISHSWLLGKNDNFYVGLGFGLKRLYNTPGLVEDPFGDVMKYIPTFRIVNVGFAF